MNVAARKKRRMDGTGQVTKTCVTRQLRAASRVPSRGDRPWQVVRMNVLCDVSAVGCGEVNLVGKDVSPSGMSPIQ